VLQLPEVSPLWVNCKQSHCCLWCGGSHLHRNCPERENASSTLTCCNCQLAEGEAAHTANYHGCSHVKDEMWKEFQGNQKPQPEECSLQILQHQLCPLQLSLGAPQSKTRETIYAMRKYQARISAGIHDSDMLSLFKNFAHPLWLALTVPSTFFCLWH
jgi:hypothetical protein